MDLNNSKGTESEISNDSKVRRTFLKRASAGAIIASIPGRSAWAGIEGSIVASGNSSDFNQGACTMLLADGGYNISSHGSLSFDVIFGGNPFDETGAVRTTDLTFEQILTSAAAAERGINDVNVGIVVMYLNAINHGIVSGIFYPVLTQHSNDPAMFASYLYTAALGDPAGVGVILGDTIMTYSGAAPC